MLTSLGQLAFFTAQALIIVILILLLLIGILAILSRGKGGFGGITVDNLSDEYHETKEELLAEVLTKDQMKQRKKEQKKSKKDKDDQPESTKKTYVINFEGDIKASAVESLCEEVTAVLCVATPEDEVVVRLESPGGMVHSYGLAAAQLQRIRQKNIPLTVAVDKVAASGGYMMASVANKIISAPFAIIGSIGVIVQIPNFHRLLKEHHIDFEQLTAGNFKRTLTMFGQNTEEGREKLREEIEDIHRLFKDMIAQHRPALDIEKVSTGEHWLGTQALELKLVDEIKTSDDYLIEKCNDGTVYEICYHMKKTLVDKLATSINILKKNLMGI